MAIKFDQTYIAVRQRSILETFDLSLQIARDHFLPLTIALLVGCAPWIVIDYLILYRWQAAEQNGWFFTLLFILVAVQAPLGTAIITDYLGMVMFRQKKRMGKSIRHVFKNYSRLIWLHGCLRLAIPVTLMAALMMPDWEIEIQSGYAFFLYCVAFLGLAVRIARPFVTEVVLLEKPKWNTENANQVSFSMRSRTLHSPATGMLIGQAMLSFLFAALLFLSFHSIFAIRGYITGYPGVDFLSYPLFVPLACWLAAGFTTIARFLSYIDLRIRQEGWEVELKLRAEANKYLNR